MAASSRHYIPPLAYHRLTALYDPILRVTMRESQFKARLLDEAEIQPGQLILDLGCGTATLINFIAARYPDTTVVGIDPDQAALGIASLKTKRAGFPLRFVRGLGNRLPFPDGRFDRVFSSLVFHHMDSPAKRDAIKEALRILKPGGQFHIADFGPPANIFMWLTSSSIRLVDGFKTTRDNFAGNLPNMFRETGFISVSETARINTLGGTLHLIAAAKPA